MGFLYLLCTGALNRWTERVCRWRTTAPSLQGPAFKQGLQGHQSDIVRPLGPLILGSLPQLFG